MRNKNIQSILSVLGRIVVRSCKYLFIWKYNRSRTLFNIVTWAGFYQVCVTMCFIALFSNLVAQEPHKDRGADGQQTVKALLVGQKMPAEFWTREHLFFVNGDTVRRSLEKYKGKMLVLDFWASGCAPCLAHQEEIKEYTSIYKSDLAVVMVNGRNTRDSYDKLKRLYDKGHFEKFGITRLESIILDEYLTEMFSAFSFPTYAWINKIHRLQLLTYRNLLDRSYVAPFTIEHE